MKFAFLVAVSLATGILLGWLVTSNAKPYSPTSETRSLLSSLHNDKWNYELKSASIFDNQCFVKSDIRLVRGHWWASIENRSTFESLNHRFSLRDLECVNEELKVKINQREHELIELVSLQRALVEPERNEAHEGSQPLIEELTHQVSNALFDRELEELMEQCCFRERLSGRWDKMRSEYIWDTRD